MEIAGFIKNSFVDYPGVISSVIFTPFCNFRCWYCHNCDVICETKGTIKEDDVFSFLNQRKKFIDGVVISGGEPTLQKDLFEFIEKIKKMNFKVKLDTNGTNLQTVKKLVNAGLIDYIAMDIKAPFEKYKMITKVDFPINIIKESINYIKSCGVEHEFRTTYSPDLNKEDVLKIAKIVGKENNFSLQQYNKNAENALTPHSESEVKEAGKLIQSEVKDLKIKGIKTNF